MQVVPDNIVVAAVNTNVLGLITFSLMFGVALGSLGEGRGPVRGSGEVAVVSGIRYLLQYGVRCLGLAWHGAAQSIVCCHTLE